MRREAGAGAARRLLGAVALMAAALACAALWVAHTRGLPDGVARVIMSAVAGPQAAVETGRVRLRGLRNVHVEGLKVYARGVVGPAGFECDRAVVRCSPVRAFRGKGWVEELHVNHAILRPAFVRPRGDLGGHAPKEGAASGRGMGSYRLSAALFECAGVSLRNLLCDVTPEDSRVLARNVRCRVGEAAGGGETDCKGELLIDAAARTVSGSFETGFDPVAVVPILRFYGLDFTCALIGRFGFGAQPPHAEFTFVKPMDVPRKLRVDARLRMENFRYRGVDVTRGDATVVIDLAPERLSVALSPLVVTRPEGEARADLTVDASDGLVRFNGSSSLHPRALARLIGIFTNAWTDAVVVEGDFRIESTGAVDLRGDSRQFIRTSVRGGRFGAGRFAADEAAFTVLTQGATSRVEHASGRLFGGTVEGQGLVVAPRGGDSAQRYRATASLRDGDFGQLVATAHPGAGVEDMRGRISLNLDLEGPLGSNWWHDVRGIGDVKVREGRVFMLPVFGGLSDYLARIVPGVDFVLSQRDFTSEFVLERQRVRSDRVSVEGNVLSLQGAGSYGFVDGDLDFAAQVKLMKDDPLIAKVVRVITWPLSKLFEFRLTGTLDAPRWYPVNFSGELLEKLGLKDGKDARGGNDIQP